MRGGAGAEPSRIENQLGINAFNNILATGYRNSDDRSKAVTSNDENGTSRLTLRTETKAT